MDSKHPVAPERELAAQLIARRSDSANATASGSVALACLVAELCRWVGAEGCRALLSRALTRTQRGRPALASLRVGSESPPVIEGVEESLEAHGQAAIASGIEDTMIATLELLKRLIGEDLTTQLAERSMTGAAPDAISPTRKGRRPND